MSWLVPALAAVQLQTCTVPAATREAIADIVRAVNAGSAGALSDVATARWGASLPAPRRAGLLASLADWRFRSGNAEPLAICASHALLRNGLTHEVDSLWYDVDSLTGRVRAMRFPRGGRVELAARDTASDRARVQALDSLVRRLAAGGAFSGEVVFARGGRVLYHAAHGVANRETGRPARRGEPYSIASVGKMFTGTAIMKLVEDGRLRLDDTLGAWLGPADRPRDAGAVPLKYLLTHTSGIVRGQDSLAFAPGSRFLYDNYGYYLLGKVIERATGEAFDAYFRRAIFAPLGMTATRRLVVDAPDPALPPAYDVQSDSMGTRFVVNPQAQTTPATGAGGMFSTAGDLFRFAEGLRSGRLLPIPTVRRMRQPHPEWGAVDYGFGIDRMRGGSIWGANGYIPGANADVEIYGDSGYVLVVVANMPANEPVRRLVAALVGPRDMA